MSSPLFKFPGAILAHARNLVAGGEPIPPAALTTDTTPPTSVTAPAAASEWDMERGDKSFWASMVAADRRLADLRRAIDQAAAEAIAREAAVKAPLSPDTAPASHLGERRCETAARVITDALGVKKP